jgi:DNA-binding transcriptional ArsR family regulator
LLRGEKNVQQISQIVVMSHSAVSHQLRGLRQMRIVRTRKQGRMVFYSLDDDHVKELFLLGLDHVCHE